MTLTANEIVAKTPLQAAFFVVGRQEGQFEHVLKSTSAFK